MPEFEEIDSIPDYMCVPGFFAPEECENLEREFEKLKFKPSETYSTTNDDSRKSMESVAPPENPFWDLVLDRISGGVVDINDQVFGFKLSKIQGFVRLIKYADQGDHFTWHSDRGFGVPVRKLSFTVQLSDPTTYGGGNLELNSGEVATIEKGRGSLVVFPAFILHRVTPIQFGTRRAIVGWFSGPSFR